MARKRMIESSLAYDADFNALSIFAQLLYLKVLPHTDDFGRFEADARILKARIDPLSTVAVEEYERALREIAEAGLWFIYGIHDGKSRILQYKQATFDRVNAFMIKSRVSSEFTGYQEGYEVICGHIDPYTIERYKIKDKGKKIKDTARASTFDVKRAFEEMWKTYPNKDGRAAAARHFSATVHNDTELSLFKRAIENYLKSSNVARGYTKNGSTFFNNWQDWVEPTALMMQGGTKLAAHAQSATEQMKDWKPPAQKKKSS